MENSYGNDNFIENLFNGIIVEVLARIADFIADAFFGIIGGFLPNDTPNT